MDTRIVRQPLPRRINRSPARQTVPAITSRANWVTGRIVEAALQMQKRSGDTALAAALLRMYGVPLAVALRVLTMPGNRRLRARPCF